MTLKLVQTYFKDRFSEELDETYADYVQACLSQADPKLGFDEQFEQLDQVLCGICTLYGCVPDGERLCCLLDLHQQMMNLSAHSSALPSNNSSTTTSSDRGASASCVDACMLAVPVANSDVSVCATDSSAPTYSQPLSSPSSHAIGLLSELCPAGLCGEYVEHILNMHGGIDEAVEWVLNTGEAGVQLAQASWQAAQDRAIEEQAAMHEERRRLKQLMLSKYDLTAFKLVEAGTKKVERKPVMAYGTGKQSDKAPTKVRWRDGQPVAFKGEKFIVEKVGEEWDGGSRGKVYTKGKRGKGFV